MGCALHPRQTSQEPTPCRSETKPWLRFRTHLFLRETARARLLSLAALDSPIRQTLHATLPKAHRETARARLLSLAALDSPIRQTLHATLPKAHAISARRQSPISGPE